MFNTCKNIKICAIVALIFCSLKFYSQRGKDGAGVINAANTIVNTYATLTSNANGGVTTVLSLNSASGFSVGDLVYIIQMQGASVNCFQEGINPNNSQPAAFNYGRITNYNNAGNNEYAQVFSVSGTSITLDCALTNSYTASGKVQVIRVPRYTSLTINANASIGCPAWNGSTGGVIAIEVLGNTTINPTGSIVATATGFRGGMVNGKTNSAFGGGAWGHLLNSEGACKGESIAGDTVLYGTLFSGKFGKGAVANGGGGGAAVNGGGGGGANGGDTSAYINGFGVPNISTANFITAWNLEAPGTATVVSSGGGRGGYTFSNSNSSPLTTAPGNGSWAGDNRRVQGGLGGRPLNYNSGRLYLGGGGGAGDHDNNYGGRGGNGGGIINIISYGIISGGGVIVSNGENGANSNASGNAPFNNCNGRDGGGGGGGGGAISVRSEGGITTVTLVALGGNGGNQQMKSGFVVGNASMAYGPGGGGGGGYIGTTPAIITTSVGGGINGTVQYLSGNENCQIDNLFPANGATSGNSGTVTASVIKNYTLATTDATICSNSSATLFATTNNTVQSFSWYSSEVGPTQIGTGAAFTTSVFTTPGTYTVWAQNCPGTYREPAYITVVSNPTVVATSTTICGPQTVTLTASGATTYTWSTGSNSATTVVTPTATTVYTVTASNGCTAQTTATVSFQALPSLTITPTSTVICANQTITLNTTGSTGTYSWNTGATTSVITVTTSGVYTATLTNACGSITRTINISDGPATSVNLSASANTICAGNSVTLTANGTGPFTWNTSTVTTNSITVTNPGTFVVTVSNICGTAASSVILTSGPLPTITIVPASTAFCTGQTASLIASGATTYTWSDNSTSPTFTTNSAANYTVNGSNSCGNTRAVYSVTFLTSPDISASSNRSFLCPAETAVITATNFSGGGNYVWSSSSNTTNTETVTAGGVYTVSYVNVCGSANVTVSVRQSTLVPDFAPLPSSGFAPLAVTFTNTSVNNIFNAWNFGNGQTSSSIHGNQEYTTTGIYTINLVITNADGCKATISRTIEVTDKPVTLGVVPELVTPNNDGKNDVWEIKGIENFANSEVEIFNRWGNLVYSATNYKNTFDGTPNAKSSSGKLPTGTYFFILKLNDQNSTVYKGYLQLAY